MTKKILMGNEAVAVGALHAGVRVVTGYPGTPSTGCLAHLLSLDLPDRHVEWSTNEKVAFEIAAGAAWAGQRAMCTMKMSGVNVAYDALISIAYSGTNGGLVIYVADDPGVSAGMPEQDTRGFAVMSDLPMLEPSSPSEAYRLVQEAFELSEAVGSPVFLRLTTAIALAHTAVDVDEPTPPEDRPVILEKNITKYTKAGSKICLDQHRDLIERLHDAAEWVRARGLNRLDLSDEPAGLGIVCSGAVNAYLDEALASAAAETADTAFASRVDDASILRIATTVPFPEDAARRLLDRCDTLLVLEELEPIAERRIATLAQRIGWTGRIVGKLDETLPRLGEYRLSAVHKGLQACGTSYATRRVSSPPQATGHEPQATTRSAPRPITVCAGCPHRGTYLGIEAAIEAAGLSKDDVLVTGDIGCTILGMNPPFDLLWTEVSMGSSLGIAQGYVLAGIETPVIATIGDSTFFHGGIPGLINAIQHNAQLTLVILDNGWTSMTGMQVNPGTDDALQGEGSRQVDLPRVVGGLGPDSVTVVDPYDVDAVANAVGESLFAPGVDVVIAQRECAIQARRRGVLDAVMTVDPETCILCKKCLRITGCPALSIRQSESKEPSSIQIDEGTCNGCGICATVCPTGALVRVPIAPRTPPGENPASGRPSNTGKEATT